MNTWKNSLKLFDFYKQTTASDCSTTEISVQVLIVARKDISLGGELIE
jgi:hypothetical protein